MAGVYPVHKTAFPIILLRVDGAWHIYLVVIVNNIFLNGLAKGVVKVVKHVACNNWGEDNQD